MSHCILVKVGSTSVIISVIVYLGRNKLRFSVVVTLHPILWLLFANNFLSKPQLCIWLLNLAAVFSLLILILLHVFEKTLVYDNSLSACGFVVWPFMCFAPCSLHLWADSSDSQLLIELVSLWDVGCSSLDSGPFWTCPPTWNVWVAVKLWCRKVKWLVYHSTAVAQLV